MSITYKHPDWQNMIYEWTLNRDCIKGESQIKRYNQAYLPIPASFLFGAPSPGIDRGQSYAYNYSSFGHYEIDDYHIHWDSRINPNYHQIEAYQSYKTRARFPEITEKTALAMLGLATLNEPVVELPSSMEYLREKATKSGRDLNSLYKLVLEEVLQTGREILIADPEEGSSDVIYVVPYSAENLINWNASSEEGDDVNFTMAVLTEKVTKIDKDFNRRSSFIYNCLRVEDGVYTVEKWTDYENKGEPVKEITSTPNFKGDSVNALPMVAVGSTDVVPDVDKPPLSGISRIAIQLYQMDADLRQSEYMTCNPTLFITGIDKDDAPKATGSTLAIVLPDPTSKAFYPSTDTSALTHIINHSQNLFQEAYNMGATLLGSNKASVESAEALNLRKSSFGASLSSVVDNAGYGIEKILKIIAVWKGENPDEVSFTPNKDFAGLKLSPEEIKIQLEAYLNSAISLSTFLTNMEKSGHLQEGETAEDELERIRDQAPVITGASSTNVGSNDNNDEPLDNED